MECALRKILQERIVWYSVERRYGATEARVEAIVGVTRYCERLLRRGPGRFQVFQMVAHLEGHSTSTCASIRTIPVLRALRETVSSTTSQFNEQILKA